MLVKPVKIGNRPIGPGNPCFAISEVGINYEKDMKLSKRMIDMSARAGFDSVKFQVFSAKGMYTKNAGSYELEGKKIDIYREMDRVSMPFEWLSELKSYSEKKGLVFFASASCRDSADALDEIGVEVHKLTSYEITNVPLLRHVAKKGKPVILSTGGAFMEEVREAVETIRKAGNEQIILMQCVAKYPAPLAATNLLAMKAMEEEFSVPVGFSDNGSGFMNEDIERFGERAWILAPLGAVSMGACILEKHTTLDRTLPGNDQRYSIEEKEQAEMINGIRQIEKRILKGEKVEWPDSLLLGSGIKKPHESEKYVRDFCFKRLFTAKKIGKGQAFTEGNVKIVRPGKCRQGLAPKEFDRIVGRARASKNLEEDMPITEKDLDFSH
ncbi:MAG: N-acetylneuraminate synthase family protein [Candidatus Diapherotrites archaeon]|uniref:N-acetylneuraminate synthase family protein n=1 Tax=Candidatus Iainarchaeum sp. TaxID=3101447 RepID=A0A939C4R2_9ARCH|nr:N-acetylneuraminate synthase family protein [Candidatus Diapherotrites archaeon]